MIMEKERETTIWGVGFAVCSPALGFRDVGCRDVGSMEFR